jgi:hypothetical protein
VYIGERPSEYQSITFSTMKYSNVLLASQALSSAAAFQLVEREVSHLLASFDPAKLGRDHAIASPYL